MESRPSQSATDGEADQKFDYQRHAETRRTYEWNEASSSLVISRPDRAGAHAAATSAPAWRRPPLFYLPRVLLQSHNFHGLLGSRSVRRR